LRDPNPLAFIREAEASGGMFVAPAHVPLTMDRFIHEQNLALFRFQIAQSELGVPRDQVRHDQLLRLLAAEEAKDN